MSNAETNNLLADLHTVVLDSQGTKIKVWRRTCEMLSCVSVFDRAWAQVIMVDDKQIEARLKASKGSDLSESEFALVPGIGMQFIYKIYKDCNGNFDKAHLRELRVQHLNEVKYSEDVS